MKNFLLVIGSIALTAVCWGVYGPVIRAGTAAMGGSHLRPFICVGIAYFLIAIVAPFFVLRSIGEKGRWTSTGTIWSLAAGAAGAIGALGIILAFARHGSPIYVMPLVFGCAPVVNTFLTMSMAKSYKQAGPLFYAGLILVVTGAVTVLIFKPTDRAAVKPPAAESTQAESTAGAAPGTQELAKAAPAGLTVADMAMITLFVALTALSWGVYGPILHKGQMAMEGSRLRPLICVGVSYFAIAVVVPVALIALFGEHGEFSIGGTLWSLAGGAAGAIGALGIILAFTFGGKPVFVMPLVFGGAPVINTIASIAAMRDPGEIGPLFYAGLIIVVVGAANVLIFAPKAAHKPPPKVEEPVAPEAPAEEAEQPA